MAENEPVFADNTNALQSLDEALYELWDRMKKAVDRIQALTRENEQLKERNQALESEMREMQEHVEKKSALISQLESSGGTEQGVEDGERVFYLSNEEREQLEHRIDELLARIDAHLR